MDYFLGIDIGSTTVKYVLVDKNYKILQKDYKAHNTKQALTLLNILQNIDAKLLKNIKKAFITGSGANTIAPLINAKFIQEVNAVILAVQKLHKEVNSVIELGGQDAKVIVFKEFKGQKRAISNMNEKCASGTGATIEKCTAKVGLKKEDLNKLEFNPDKLHYVAAKCGVFAETDIINLLKASVPSNEILNSLADAIVMQNLSSLTKGEVLKPKVLLLGGPNKYLPFLQEAWRYRIAQIWDERGVKYHKENLKELIFTPNDAELYAALGAVIFGLKDGYKDNFCSLEKLKFFIESKKDNLNRSDAPLIKNQKELEEFKKEYELKAFIPKTPKYENAYLGIDGGSTSSKAVLIDKDNTLLFKTYTLSQGNPIEDTLKLLKDIKTYTQKYNIKIGGFGVTGYAADVLQKALFADANIIETIAHLKGSKAFFGDDIDIICDIGGQDIKVLFLENGNVKNFKLSNQCSAGNGAMLQSMATQFGVELKDFAKFAFKAEKAPNFNYGCAVFIDSDRVNFQKEGYTQEELFAGMSKVLPKNVWQYVVQEPNLAKLGKNFVLQGGTQYNLAALKAQVDYIKSQVNDAKIHLHPHPGEAGAIGAAIAAKEAVLKKESSSFVGLDEALEMQYFTKTDASTTCHFCPMKCTRTFIDTKLPSSKMVRYIAGFKCERGMVESKEELKKLQEEKKLIAQKYPNLVEIESKELFSFKYHIKEFPKRGSRIESLELKNFLGIKYAKRVKREFKRGDLKFRKNIKIAIPRVLNIYQKAPFLRHFFLALGIDEKNIIFTPYSSQKLFLKGAKYSSNDPCYPAKVSLSHIYTLLFENRYKDINYIYFPSINEIDSFLSFTMGNAACPIVSGTPSVAKSAFLKEKNLFKERGVEFIDNTLSFANLALLKEQLYQSWKDRLKITKDESNFAVDEALKAQNAYLKYIENLGKNILKEAIAKNEIVILLIGRPYHLDPGINHEILKEFQAHGFKVLTINSIPKDKEFLKEFFTEDLAKGYIKDIFDINDVWSENFSTNSAQKVWAAKFAARVPNVAVVDISSFKCGHDAPTYAIIDKILSYSETPHLMLHDLDANKPSGTIKIRVKTFVHTLNEYREKIFYKRVKV